MTAKRFTLVYRYARAQKSDEDTSEQLSLRFTGAFRRRGRRMTVRTLTSMRGTVATTRDWLSKARKPKTRRRTTVFAPRSENDDSPKVYVPPSAFNGKSPERQAADILKQMLTYTAVHVVLGQLQMVNNPINVPTPDNESDANYNAKRIDNQYDALWDFLERNPIRGDPDAWIEKLMERDSALAQRILICRNGYATMDFEWNEFKKLTLNDLETGNEKLLAQSFERMMGSATSS